jgi:hypothetical protein
MSFGKRGNLVGAALALAAAILVLAGCGGGGGGAETTETTSGLTKAEFVKKGNAICARTEKEIAAGVEKFTREHSVLKTKPPSEKQIAELAEEVLVPKVRRQIDEIRALGIPSGDEEEVEAIFAAAEEALKETEANPSVFGKGGVGPFAKTNELAREYGLTVCGAEPENEEGKGLEQGKGLGE